MHSGQGKGSDHYSILPLFHELVRRGLAESYGDARRLVRSGRVSVNKGMVGDETMIVTNLTEINVGMDAGHRTFSIPEGYATRGGQQVDPLELAEEVISAFCSEILCEICTTGHLTLETYGQLSELAFTRGALAEMIGAHRFGPVVNQGDRS